MGRGGNLFALEIYVKSNWWEGAGGKEERPNLCYLYAQLPTQTSQWKVLCKRYRAGMQAELELHTTFTQAPSKAEPASSKPASSKPERKPPSSATQAADTDTRNTRDAQEATDATVHDWKYTVGRNEIELTEIADAGRGRHSASASASASPSAVLAGCAIHAPNAVHYANTDY